MQKAIEIAGVSVKPDSRQSIDIPLPSFYTHSSVNMPVHVVHGRNPGPVLLVANNGVVQCAAVNGCVGTNVYIVANGYTTKLLDPLPGSTHGSVTKSTGADYHPRRNPATFTDPGPGLDYRTVLDLRVSTNANPAGDMDAVANAYPVTQLSSIADG